MRWALSRPDLSETEKFVLAAIARRVGVGRETIQENEIGSWLQMPWEAVRQAIARLEELRYIEVEWVRHGGAPGYRVLYESAAQKS